MLPVLCVGWACPITSLRTWKSQRCVVCVCVCVEGFMSKCRVLLTGSSPSVLAAVCDTSQAVQGDAASRADPGLSWLC